MKKQALAVFLSLCMTASVCSTFTPSAYASETEDASVESVIDLQETSPSGFETDAEEPEAEEPIEEEPEEPMEEEPEEEEPEEEEPEEEEPEEEEPEEEEPEEESEEEEEPEEESEEESEETFKFEVDSNGDLCGFNGTMPEHVVIPAEIDGVTVKGIGGGLFYQNQTLKSITFAEDSQVEKINAQAFSGCKMLTDVSLPSSLTYIGFFAFGDCSNLVSLNIAAGSKLDTIGIMAFERCTSLTNVSLPATLTCVENGAFRYCHSLSSVSFGENSALESIGRCAFQECTPLTSVIIPERVTTVMHGAFADCDNLTSVIFEGDPSKTYADAECLSIEEYAFARTAISEITIPRRVKTMGVVVFITDVLTIYGYGTDCEAYNYYLKERGSKAWTYVEIHSLSKVEAKEATCCEEGNILYWECTDANCGKLFTDEAGNNEIDPADVILDRDPENHVNVVIDEAVAATCTEAGKTEGSHCSLCNEVIAEQTIVDALGHDFSDNAETCRRDNCDEANPDYVEPSDFKNGSEMILKLPSRPWGIASVKGVNRLNVSGAKYVTYYSDNLLVAAVSIKDGKVTAYGKGTATITAVYILDGTIQISSYKLIVE